MAGPAVLVSAFQTPVHEEWLAQFFYTFVLFKVIAMLCMSLADCIPISRNVKTLP